MFWRPHGATGRVATRGAEWFVFAADGRIAEIRSYYQQQPNTTELDGFPYAARGYSDGGLTGNERRRSGGWGRHGRTRVPRGRTGHERRSERGAPPGGGAGRGRRRRRPRGLGRLVRPARAGRAADAGRRGDRRPRRARGGRDRAGAHGHRHPHRAVPRLQGHRHPRPRVAGRAGWQVAVSRTEEEARCSAASRAAPPARCGARPPRPSRWWCGCGTRGRTTR